MEIQWEIHMVGPSSAGIAYKGRLFLFVIAIYFYFLVDLIFFPYLRHWYVFLPLYSTKKQRAVETAIMINECFSLFC